MAQSKNKRLTKIVLIITLIIIGWLVFEFIVRGFDVVRQEYGINPASFIKVLIGSEIIFDLGILLIILGSGAFKLRLKHIFNLDFQNIVFENKLVYIGFTMNRIAAFVPPIYLLWNGWGRLPLLITILLIAEMFIVLVITTIPFEFRKYFSKSGKTLVRTAVKGDIGSIAALEKKVWKNNAAPIESIDSRIDVFNKGSLVATIDDNIVGYVSTVIVSKKTINEAKTWYELTDNGLAKGVFDPKGDILFGISLTVDEDYRNKKIGSKLMINVARMAIENNLKYGTLGGRLPCYYKYKQMDITEYINAKNDKGGILDPELRFYTKLGLKIMKIKKDYFHDPESLDYGVILKWENPFYKVTKKIPLLAKPLSYLFRI